jgi:hypothetical protein
MNEAPAFRRKLESQNTVENKCGGGAIGADVLGPTWGDIAELLSVLDVGQDRSREDLVAALTRLQRSRAERAAATVREHSSAEHLSRRDVSETSFQYVPVLKSVSKGERILQGIYRVIRGRSEDHTEKDTSVRDHGTGREKAELEHAIQYLLDCKNLARFLLMVSVDVETLHSPYRQMQYSTVLRSAQLRVKRHLLVEVTGYKDSDDTIGVQRALNELRVHSHAVFLNIAHGDFSKLARQCKKLGAQVLGINVAQLENRRSQIGRALNRVASIGEQFGIPIFIDGINDVPTLAKAIACGASYICAPALRPPVKAPDEVNAATLDDLYEGI